jgi:hypothetical protein
LTTKRNGSSKRIDTAMRRPSGGLSNQEGRKHCACVPVSVLEVVHVHVCLEKRMKVAGNTRGQPRLYNLARKMMSSQDVFCVHAGCVFWKSMAPRNGWTCAFCDNKYSLVMDSQANKANRGEPWRYGLIWGGNTHT